MTREEALGKAAEMLNHAENSVGEAHLSKHVTLASLYMTLAHELKDADD